MTASGWQPDVDCDTVPDRYDNCPSQTNVDQYDRNRNGFGDACDLLIDYITVEPNNRLKQGNFAKLSVSMINNRDGPVGDVLIRVASSSLDIQQQLSLEMVPAGEQARLDFWLKIPKCASTGRHDVTITSGFTEPYTHDHVTEVEETTFIIEKGDLCGSENGPLDNTIIEAFHNVVVDRTDSTIIPVRLTNFNPSQADYHVMVEDLGTWGNWRFDPSADVQLPSGKHATLYLYLETEAYAPAGTKTITITVTADNQQTTIPIDVYVRAPMEKARVMGTFFVQLALIILAVLIVGFILALAVGHFIRRHEKPKKKRTKKAAVKNTPKKARKKVAVENVTKQKRKTYY